jgi:hypothetical protein
LPKEKSEGFSLGGMMVPNIKDVLIDELRKLVE